MSIDTKLLRILRCPISKQELQFVNEADIKILNQQINNNELKHSDGSIVNEQLLSALVTTNQQTIYKIINGVPIMLEDKSIPVIQIRSNSILNS